MEKEYPKNVRRALRRMDTDETLTWPVDRTDTIRNTITSLKRKSLANWVTEKIGNEIIVTKIADREPIRE